MAISVGKYIIRSALDENLVLMASGGSKSKGARITTGGLTEDDNRCYWHVAITNGTRNTIKNVNTGDNGYIMANSASVGINLIQDAGYYKNKKKKWILIDRCEWIAELSGKTMQVNGSDVNTYYLKYSNNQTLCLTLPDNGGDAVLGTFVPGTPSTATVTTSRVEFEVTLDRITFEDAVDNESGTYVFSYDGADWSLNSTTVSLNTYGISTEDAPASGDTITVVFVESVDVDSSRQEFYFQASTNVNRGLATPSTLRNSDNNQTYVVSERTSKVSVTSTGNVKNPSVNKSTFESQITATGVYTFTFSSSKWHYNNSEVIISDYGITYTGNPANNNQIVVTYFAAYQSLFYPNWKCSSSGPIYELRYRTRLYDPDGNIDGDWSYWTGWNRYAATGQQVKVKKKWQYNGTMKGNDPITLPVVNNTNYIKADMQIEARLTSAKNWNSYNTDGVQHGMAVSQIISHYLNPSLTFLSAIYSPDGLALTYQTDYKIPGSTIVIHSILDNGVTLIEDYSLEIAADDDYYGDLYLACDELYSLPKAGDTITISATFSEENGIAKTTVSNTLTVAFDSNWGLDIQPYYEITDRLTVLAGIKKYSTLQLYLEKIQLDGTSYWAECDKVYEGPDGSNEEIVVFEIAPAFGKVPNLMWVAVDEDSQWTNAIVSVPDIVINSKYYTWFWVDDYNQPHAVILKYNIDEVMQPDDNITLGANKFITTGREYPVFRYSKSLERALDIKGIVLKDESDIYCGLDDFESLAMAQHCIYRQPDGKWFQVAIESIKFTKKELYTIVNIGQEAETR